MDTKEKKRKREKCSTDLESNQDVYICITRKKTQECPGSHQANVYGVSGPKMGQFDTWLEKNNDEHAMTQFPITLCKGFAYTMYLHTDAERGGKQIGEEDGLQHNDICAHPKVFLGDIDTFPCKDTKHLKLRLTYEPMNDTAVHSKIPRGYFGKNGSNLAGMLNNCQKEKFPKHNWEIVKDNKDPGVGASVKDHQNQISFKEPGTKADVDDQDTAARTGQTPPDMTRRLLCTSFAMAKVVVDALDQGKWTNGEEYDAVQDKMVEKMEHIHKGQPRWPDEFRGKCIIIEANKKVGGDKKTLKITFDTQTCKPNKDPFMPGNDIIPILAVVVVPGSVISTGIGGLHSVYAQNYIPESRTFDCINSWGTDHHAYPQVADSALHLLELISAEVEFLD